MMLTEEALRRELKLVDREMREAITAGNQERQDWLYGAKVALSWAIDDPDNQTMRPSRAFIREKAIA